MSLFNTTWPRQRYRQQAKERIDTILNSWIDGDEPEGAPSTSRTFQAIIEIAEEICQQSGCSLEKSENRCNDPETVGYSDTRAKKFKAKHRCTASKYDPIARWTRQHEETQGHYAGFAGFEFDLRKRNEALAELYDHMDIQCQVGLFGFVVDLLSEAANETEIMKQRAEDAEMRQDKIWGIADEELLVAMQRRVENAVARSCANDAHDGCDCPACMVLHHYKTLA